MRPFVAAAAFAAAAVAAAGCARRPSAAAEGTSQGAPEPALTVAAAADLALAFKELGDAYVQAGHPRPTFTFGSTGLLAKQIAEGAPFDVFAAANVTFAEDAVRTGQCDGATKALYARGRVVMWTKRGVAPPPPDLAALADARYAKIAIANPEHAPYGKAAREAMIAAGVWERVRPRLVFGENVQQTLQYAQTGNADVAVVALSLATATDGTWTPIPLEKHEPIDQALVVCGKGARAEAARAFVAFLSAPPARAVMRRYGFLLPGESLEAAKSAAVP